MVDVEDLPAWARRRLDRHFKRGGSGRIVRWMTVPTGASAESAADAPSRATGSSLPADNVLVFARAPSPAAPTGPVRTLAAG